MIAVYICQLKLGVSSGRINDDLSVVQRAHLLHGWKILIRITVMRIHLDQRMVFKYIGLYQGVQIGKVSRLFFQKLINIVFCLAPVIVLGSVFAVADANSRVAVLTHKPVLVDLNLFSICEAERLRVPRLLMII